MLKIINSYFVFAKHFIPHYDFCRLKINNACKLITRWKKNSLLSPLSIAPIKISTTLSWRINMDSVKSQENITYEKPKNFPHRFSNKKILFYRLYVTTNSRLCRAMEAVVTPISLKRRQRNRRTVKEEEGARGRCTFDKQTGDRRRLVCHLF